ncbi:MAG TPA: hypothetical protein VNN98_05995 [Rhizomicrobium sp.]|nr:hypothetical protein [Rhizomicrobium sp.]
MNPRDLFGVALRMLGVWFVYNAAYAGLYLAMKEEAMPFNSTVSATQDKLLVGFYLALAFILLVLPNHVVALCYGPEKKT